MIQFGIKSLILLTAIVATYGLVIHVSLHGQDSAILLALVPYVGLIGVVIRNGIKTENDHNERATRKQDADESKPAS
jgi:hypothetical protein